MYGYSQAMPVLSTPISTVGTVGQMVNDGLFQRSMLALSDGSHGGGSVMVAEPGSSRHSFGALVSRTSTPIGQVHPGRHRSQGTINRSTSPPRGQPRNPLLNRRRLPNVELEAHQEKTDFQMRLDRIESQQRHISQCAAQSNESIDRITECVTDLGTKWKR